jgi:putative transposase
MPARLMNIPRSSYRYRGRRDDSELRERLIQQSNWFARSRASATGGFKFCCSAMGSASNHKRVQRVYPVYRAAGLCLRQTRRKRLTRAYTAPQMLSAPHQEWAIDFASDVAASGATAAKSSAWWMPFMPECLAWGTDTSLPSRRLTRAASPVG